MAGDERRGRSPEELAEQVDRDLARAEVADDETRLATLEDVHARLEGELEGDLDQAGSTRH